jgi:hypothetical protein
MKKIERLAYKDLFHVIGDPGTGKGRKAIKNQLITLETPFPLNGGRVNKIVCNKHIGPAVIDAYQEILNHYGLEEIQAQRYDQYGGCYNHRKTRDGKWFSVHSWGAAIDILMKYGGYGKDPKDFPQFIIDAFVSRGFYWGGYWKRPDGMHFSICNG